MFCFASEFTKMCLTAGQPEQLRQHVVLQMLPNRIRGRRMRGKKEGGEWNIGGEEKEAEGMERKGRCWMNPIHCEHYCAYSYNE